MDYDLEARFAKAKRETRGETVQPQTQPVKTTVQKVNTPTMIPAGQTTGGDDPYDLQSRFAKAKEATAVTVPMPTQSQAQRTAQRDDGAVRESYAKRHPEMTGGEAGARTREINSGWVRATETKKKAQEEVDRLQAEADADAQEWVPRRDVTPRSTRGQLDRAKEALKKAEDEVAAWAAARYYDRGQRAFAQMDTDPVAKQSYQAADDARGDKEKLQQVLVYYSGSGLYTPEETDAILGYEKELQGKYGLTQQDFDAYRSGELTQAVLDARAKMDDALAKSRGELEAAGQYDYYDMSGYAKRLEQQQARARANEANSKLADELPVLSTIGSVVASPLRFFDLFSTDWGRGDPEDPDYIPPSNGPGIGDAVDTIRGTVSEGIKKKFKDQEWLGNTLSFLYQTGTSIGDSALSVAALGPGSVYLMGTNAAVGESRNIIDRGGTSDQALWGGLAAGAAEIAFEKFSVDNLLEPKNITGWRSWVKETLKQGGVEASEEMCTEIANILSDTAIMGEKSEFNQAVAKYMTEDGLSEEEAKRKAYLDMVGQVALAGTGGFLSGITMGGTMRGHEAASANSQFSAQGQEFQAMGQEVVDAIIQEGLDSDPATQSYKMARKLQDRQSAGKEIKARELGRLYQENVATIQAEEAAEKSGSTAVDTDPATHTPEQQAVIAQYQARTDETLKKVFQGYLDNPKQGFSRHNISDVSQRQAQDAQRLLGGAYEGYHNAINSNGIQHILGEHGPEGTADHSLGDLNDIARMGYVLDHYDDVQVVTYEGGDVDFSREFRDKNDRPAPMLKFSKRVDGTYYVVEAIPESKHKKFWVVSAYMEKAEGGTQAPDAQSPRTTPNASLASLPSADLSIPQTAQDVKTAEARVAEQEQRMAELDRQTVERGTQGLGTQGQATVAAMYLEGQDAGDYVQGMRELYAAGQAGVAMESVATEAARSLNDHQRRAAYEAGRMDGANSQAPARGTPDPYGGKAADGSAALGNLDAEEDLPFYFGSEEGAKSHEQAGELRVRDGGQRADGAGAQGAAGGVEEGAGGYSAGADRAGPADAGAGALQVGRAVSSYGLGIAGGVKTDGVQVVTGGETEAVRAARAEAESQGMELVLFTGGNLHVQVQDQQGGLVTVEARGYISGNKVYVRADHAEHTAYQLWRHELYHHLTDTGRVDPEATRMAVQRELGPELTAKLEEAYSTALYGLKGVDLWAEIAADQYGGINIFAGTEWAGEMEALGLLVGTQTEAQMANSQTARATDQRTGPPQGQQTTATQVRSGGKFSAERSDNEIYDYSKSFEEQLKDYEEGKIPKNDTLLVCGTPKVFQRVGLLSLPMTMNQTHIDYAMKGTKDVDHFLRKDGLLQLPAALEHPIAIISSKTKAGTSLVAMLEVRQNGKQVIVPMVVDGFGFQNGLQIDSNALTSTYGKNYSISRVLYDALENEANGVPFSTYYVDAKKATELFRVARVPMPKMPATSNDGFIHSIAEAGSPVKPRFRDVTQTQQFKRWFRGSKVVDAEGKPLVVYHGTDAEFTVFDRAKGRSTMDIQGSFFSPWADDARGYGSTVGAYYIALMNPADEGTAYAALRKFQGQSDAGVKAREYLISQGYDGVNNGGEEYIAFFPEQIKSATDNLGTFDRENPDIRFSREPSDYIQELRELKWDKRDLERKVAYYRSQFKLTGWPTVDRAAVRAEAKTMLDQLGVKGMSVEDVTKRMGSIYDLITTGQQGGTELSYRAVRDMAEELAYDVVTHAVEKDDSAYREYSDMRAYFKDTQIILSEADSRDIPDYGDWRRGQGRRVKLRRAKAGEMSNVDAVFHEAVSMWPQFFNEAETTSAADQVRQIADVLDGVYQITEINPYSASLETAVQWVANDIMNAFDRLPMGKGTFADRWQAKVRKAQAEGREAVRRVRAYEKARTETKIAEMKAWYQERDARAREYRKDGEARNRLLKLTQRLERMKTTTANKALIRELMGELDTAARHLTGQKQFDLEQLRRDYQDFQDPNSERYNPDFVPDPRTEKALERLSRKHIDDMTQQDVEDLTKALLNLEHEIRTSKRLLQEDENRNIYQLGKQIIEDMESVQGNKASGVSGVLEKYLTAEVLSPMRMVRRMVGWRDSSPLLKATEALNKGQRVMLDYQMRAEKPFLQFAKDKAFGEGFSGPKAREVKIGGWTKGGLQEVTVTPAMLASIYLHSLNPQNARHMAEGGVTVPDMKLYKKGELAEAYARGTTVKIKPSDSQRLLRFLTEKERAFVREAQRYFRTVSQPELSRVAETLRGYSPTMLENYFPIVTNKNFMKQEIAFDADGTATILKPGYMEERVNATGPMMLQDVDSVVERAIQQHGLFVGLAVPVRNFNKLWNVSTVGVTEGGEYYSYAGSVKEAVDNTWGNTGKRYIEKMVKDVQGRQHANDQWGGWMDKLRSKYAGAVLTLNASVAIKQAASYPTAAAVLGWKPLVQAMGNTGKVDLNLIAKYTPLQWYRSKGFASQELGDMARNNAHMPTLLNWIQGMDLLTTRKLWKASEYYVRDNNKALKVGSDAYYRAVAEVYDRVIEETQPNYTAMQRPQLLRSESDLVKNLAMFKTQPMQNLNILYDAAGDFLAKRRQFKAGEIDIETMRQSGRNLGNAVTSQLVQAGVFAGMTLVWALFRGRMDKYKDKDKDEVTAESLAKALGVDAGLNLVSGIPIIPDLGEYFVKKTIGERAYSIDVTSVSLIMDTVDAVSKVTQLAIKDITGEGEDFEGHVRTLWDAGEDISKALGIPMENVTNLFTAGYRQTLILSLGEYQGEYEAMKLTTDKDKYAKDYYNLLYKAMVKDQKAYREIYADMIDQGWDEKKLKNAMETRMKSAQGVGSVSELDHRYVAPEDEDDFDEAMGRLEGSRLWRKASPEQRDKAENIVYDLVVGDSKTSQTTLAKLAGTGIDEGTYALYKLAAEMADEASDDNGSITNAEREAAIRSMEGLNDAKRAALWVISGGKDKSNPWG